MGRGVGEGGVGYDNHTSRGNQIQANMTSTCPVRIAASNKQSKFVY